MNEPKFLKFRHLLLLSATSYSINRSKGCWKRPLYKLSHNQICLIHRHLREIDCSSAIVGGPAAGAVSGGKSIHWTRMWRQKVLHSGCCGWRHNYYDQQRQAGRANEQSTSLRCLWGMLNFCLHAVARLHHFHPSASFFSREF